MKESIVNIIENALKSGTRFVSFVYRSKGSKELARHTVALGVNIERVYRRDRSIISGKLAHLAKDSLEAVAAHKIIDSLNDSLRNGIGNNAAFSAKGAYKSLGKGVKIHSETNELQLFGFVRSKKVIEAGEHKEVKSAPLTLARQKLEKSLKKSKFRQYSLSQIRSAKIQGDVIILDVDI